MKKGQRMSRFCSKATGIKKLERSIRLNSIPGSEIRLGVTEDNKIIDNGEGKKEYKRCPCCGGEHKCKPSKCLKEVKTNVEEAQKHLTRAINDLGYVRNNLVEMSNYCIDNGWMKP